MLRAAVSARDRDHERASPDGSVERRCDVEFLVELPARRVYWVFTELDMAPCREPPFRVPVVDQEDLLRIGVDQYAVRHEMLGRRRWLCRANDLGGPVDPSQCIKSMVGLRPVERNDLVDKGANLRSPGYALTSSEMLTTRRQRPERCMRTQETRRIAPRTCAQVAS